MFFLFCDYFFRFAFHLMIFVSSIENPANCDIMLECTDACLTTGVEEVVYE